jgi:electron transfer flavoprotein beta subunit
MTVECLMDTGRETQEIQLPAVITVVKDINEPRLPSLKGKMKAKKAQITIWKAADVEGDPAKLGLNGSPTAVAKIFSPPKRSGGEVVTGETPQEAAKNLVKKLKEAQVI